MTVEDVVYIPFPGITLKVARPIPTIDLIEPFERCITGCRRKCVCRLWLNCSYYNKIKWKKSRGDEDDILKDIWGYYNDTFKIEYVAPEAFPNG